MPLKLNIKVISLNLDIIIDPDTLKTHINNLIQIQEDLSLLAITAIEAKDDKAYDYLVNAWINVTMEKEAYRRFLID